MDMCTNYYLSLLGEFVKKLKSKNCALGIVSVDLDREGTELITTQNGTVISVI